MHPFFNFISICNFGSSSKRYNLIFIVLELLNNFEDLVENHVSEPKPLLCNRLNAGNTEIGKVR